MIRSVPIARKAGFSAAFPTSSNLNPNVIDELKKYHFLGNQRLQNRLIHAFKRGYYECQRLIKEVSIDSASKSLKQDNLFKFS